MHGLHMRTLECGLCKSGFGSLGGVPTIIKGVPTIIKGVPTVTLQPRSARAYRTARPQHQGFRKSKWRRYERYTLAYSLETHHKKNGRMSGRIQQCNPYKDNNIWSLQPWSKQFCTWHTSDMPAPIHLLVLPFENLEHELYL
jgi:hypothetical protein